MAFRSILANLTARLWGILSVYIFTPLYLHFLGAEGYGFVAFSISLQAIIAFADLGFTSTVGREFARVSFLPDGNSQLGRVLGCFELLAGVLAGAVCCGLLVSAPWIADVWLSSAAPSMQLGNAVRFTAIAICCQLVSSLYIGGLMGLGRQIEANVIQVVSNTLRPLGAIAIFVTWGATVINFAVWQAIVSVVTVVVARHFVRRRIQATTRGFALDIGVLRGTWRYSIGMAAMTICGAALGQMDRMFISSMLPLEKLGVYALAATLAGIPMAITAPINMALFPKVTELVSRQDFVSLRSIYHQLTGLIGACAVPVTATLIVFAEDVLLAWTGSATLAVQAAVPCKLLLIGQLLQALTVAPYHLALAHGNVRLNLVVNVLSIFILAALLSYAVGKHGLAGAAASWLAMNLLTLPPYMYMLHKRFLSGDFMRWTLMAVALPLAVAGLIIAGGQSLTGYHVVRWYDAGVPFALCALSVALIFLFNRSVRASLVQVLHRARLQK